MYLMQEELINETSPRFSCWGDIRKSPLVAGACWSTADCAALPVKVQRYHGGSLELAVVTVFYTMEIGKCYKSRLYPVEM